MSKGPDVYFCMGVLLRSAWKKRQNALNIADNRQKKRVADSVNQQPTETFLAAQEPGWA